MPTAAERLARIRLKTERAVHHIRDLEERIARFRDSNPYEISSHKDAKSGETVIRIKLRSKIPDHFSLVIGDAVHNLRSALDHLIWQLAEANGGTPGKDHMFPFHEAASKYKPGGSARIQGVKPGAINLIDGSQPYPGGNDDLWTLHDLDRIDKHRLLLLTGFVNSGLEFAITKQSRDESASQGVYWPDAAVTRRFTHDPSFPVMLEYGTEVDLVRFTHVHSNPPVDVEIKPLFDIAFAEPQIVRGKAVLPFLHERVEFAERFIPQFLPYL